MHNLRSMSSNFLIFQTSGCISLRLAAFFYQFFFNTALSSSSINCSSLMSSRPLIIFWIGLSVISGEFPNRFLKCFFHLRSLSFWLGALCFALKMLFLLLTSLSVCFAICDCLSFCSLAFIVFLLLSKDAFF